MSIGIEKVGQINIPVHDTDRAVEFYRDTLGLQFLFRAGNLAFFDCGGVRLLVDKVEDKEFDHPSSILYFSVSDIQSSFAKLKERGVEILRDPHMIARLPDREVWMAFFKDPDANVHALMSEIKTS
jgi:predicted enzyme related to lactoylglutathione lyase